MFQKYYDSRHSGRRLTWQGNLGTADVKVRFKARTHDLNVSTQALVVLLLFEEVREDETLSYTVSGVCVDIKSLADFLRISKPRPTYRTETSSAHCSHSHAASLGY